MKEVKYNSDLNNDIDVLNTKNNAKNDAILGFGISIGIFGLIEIIAFNLGFQYTPAIILPSIITMVGTGGIVSAITGNISNKKYKRKLRKAKQSASDLQQELAKENTIINIISKRYPAKTNKAYKFFCFLDSLIIFEADLLNSCVVCSE